MMIIKQRRKACGRKTEEEGEIKKKNKWWRDRNLMSLYIMHSHVVHFLHREKYERAVICALPLLLETRGFIPSLLCDMTSAEFHTAISVM
jgi:hypothetical protein